MGTPSQTSYAARLAKAQQLHQFINTFQNYNPGIPELTSTGFQTLITQLNTTQSEYTTKHHIFAESSKERKKIFATNPNSIAKSLTKVNAYVKASKGKNSQQYIDVNTLLNKIRGESPITITNSPTQETISRSERSFGSQLQNFNDVITLLKEFNTEYAPTNTELSLISLKSLHDQAQLINNSVTTNFGHYKPKINERQNGFVTLNETANRIKEMVKSQYGTTSVEYKLIRGLNFRS